MCATEQFHSRGLLHFKNSNNKIKIYFHAYSKKDKKLRSTNILKWD